MDLFLITITIILYVFVLNRFCVWIFDILIDNFCTTHKKNIIIKNIDTFIRVGDSRDAVLYWLKNCIEYSKFDNENDVIVIKIGKRYYEEYIYFHFFKNELSHIHSSFKVGLKSFD